MAENNSMLPKKAVFFEGCTMARRMVGYRFACRFLLEKYGIEYAVLDKAECCGAPAKRAGDWEVGHKQLTKALHLVLKEGCDTIITGCPGCGAQLKGHEAHEMGIKVYHMVEILHMLAKEGKLIRPGEMRDYGKMLSTAHFPCHLNRGMGADCENLHPDVLTAFPNIDYVRMEGAEKCCGAGGGVRASQLELATAIVDRKLKNAKECGADLLIASCPFCELHINTRQKELEMGLRVIALPSFVAVSFKDFGDAVDDLMERSKEYAAKEAAKEAAKKKAAEKKAAKKEGGEAKKKAAKKEA